MNDAARRTGAAAPPAASLRARPHVGWSLVARVAVVLGVDLVLGALARSAWRDGAHGVGASAAAIALLLSAIFLIRRLYPLRWVAPGLSVLLLFVVYPVANTLYLAFTNYGDGHVLSKPQALDQLLSRTYSGGPAYAWTAYRSSGGRFLLYLRHGAARPVVAAPDGETAPPSSLPGTRPPATIAGYRRLGSVDVVAYLTDLQGVRFRTPAGTRVTIQSLGTATAESPRYVYDGTHNALRDAQTGTVYRERRGTYTAANGATLDPGYSVPIGFDNFTDIVTSHDVRGPFLSVFAWNFLFATASVVITFAAGFGVALVLNARALPFRSALRMLIILPYALPIFISASIWVGLLNPLYGPVNRVLRLVAGISPSWFQDPDLAKVALLLVGLWLGFPYMALIVLGALQSVSRDLYAAADIDGAGSWTRFRWITLPLVLAAVGPVLVGAFAFSFNNFTLIELVTKGGPPNLGAATPAGHTDILLSYTYRLAFSGGQGANYGLAAAVSVLIFLIVGAISLVNFRLSRRYTEVYELA